MFETLTTLEKVYLIMLAIGHLYFFWWIWKSTPSGESRKKKKQREEEFRNGLKQVGYWGQIENTKKEYGK
jgi:hypothetical protein